MTKETSADVASIAGDLLNLDLPDFLEAAALGGDRAEQLLDMIKSVAACALGQRERDPTNGCEMPEVAAMRYIEQLRAEEADMVVILCDDPEAASADMRLAIICNGGWTDHKDRRFYGESVLQCLAKAVSAREAGQ